MRRIVLSLLIAALAVTDSRPCAANDAQIAQQLAAQLRAKKATKELRDFQIGLKVEEGRVWLKGQVLNPQQQLIALELARRIPGVKLVVNELSIKNSGTAVAATSATTPVVNQPATTNSDSAAPQLQQPASTQLAVSTTATTATEAREQSMVPGSQPAAAESTIELTPSTPTTIHNTAANTSATAQPRIDVTSQVAVSPTAAPVSAPQVTGSGLANSAATNSSVPSLEAASDGVASMMNAGTITVAPIQHGSSSSTMPATLVAQQPTRAPRPISQSALAPTPTPVATSQAAPIPISASHAGGGSAAVSYDHPHMPGYSWPSYASYPNYGAVTYPKQYSATAWPYIGPFYPYPQVPLGWRKVSLEWDDGWWFLDFTSK